jgi:zinc transporter ZupT
MVPLSLIAALTLAAVHLFADKLPLGKESPRNKWLSFAGGSAVAYIFLHLIPELEEWQEAIQARHQQHLGLIRHPLYLVALLGLTVFYGLERMVKIHQAQRKEPSSDVEVFWLHIASFAVYNALIGSLLLYREETNSGGLFFFALAMSFHFLVNDSGLLAHHQDDYHQRGRWVVGAAVVVGWLVAYLVEIPDVVLALLFAFLGGGVVLNILKEELPEDRKSNFWAFAAGVLFYAALLLWQASLN